ncbi:NAD-dependent epimerase/dehydratase family protein [Microvirga sp. BT688]|uniref:NAD-dependent epimerase/dehydratase family protein n=1 Tax=Microvirga sp. TaxID=1873136 RepID=UPI0016826C9E|nr:NAD-dependent epimerase/dehydratase family protein [Microvirga sp.]MBD2750023.1 NAD-dependent epimerase/dehydratase family protein [Microvirga sp.]
MSRRALIGHTGFVGSNLRRDGKYTDFYNSSNFSEMAGETYDEVVCAGISATKWLANKEPAQDWLEIQKLLDVLTQTTTKRFVLISTIDVYPEPSQPLTEDAALGDLANHAYGRHRLAVESWVQERFRDNLIVRLPALFGQGLKKNALYDLLNDNGVDRINPAGAFQWYPVSRLNEDLARASVADLRLVNLFTAPLLMRDIIETFFPGAQVGPFALPAPKYNLRTQHAEFFGGRDGFVMNADEVLAALHTYIDGVRHMRAAAV